MEYYIEQLTVNIELETAKGKAEAVERLAPLVGALTNPVERAHYIQRVSLKVGVPERVIRDVVEGSRRGKRVNLPEFDVGPGATSTLLSREDELLSLLLRFPNVQSAVESELQKDLATFPEIMGDIRGSVDEPLTHIENQQVWRVRSQMAPQEQAATWLDALDPYLRERAQRLLTHQDSPELPVVNRQHHATEMAVKIANELRKTVVINRKNQLKAMYESVEDTDDRLLLDKRLRALIDYHHRVTAPRRSTFYLDLGSRLEQNK
jgi:DNA primase